MDRIPVSVIIKSLGLGGAERLIVDSLPYLDQARFDYRFAYIVPWKNTLSGAVEEAGFGVTCLGERQVYSDRSAPHTLLAGYTPSRSLRAIALMPRAYRNLARWLADSRGGVVQADLPVSGILARLAARTAGLPVVYTEHNLQERYHPLTRWLNKATYGLNSLVLAVSDEVAQSIRRNGMADKTRVVVLPNGVPVNTIQQDGADVSDLRGELNLPADRPIIGTVAVMRTQKRLADWLAVAQRVAKAHPHVLFLLVGDGPEMPHVRQWIDELGLRDRVRLTGFREDGRRLAALCDIYLMTSGFEGLPLAMLEAMALGKPVVATAIGGIPEVIQSGENGFLAPVGDVELLAAQVDALLVNRDAAEWVGAQGERTVEAYYHTRERVILMERNYRELAESHYGIHCTS